jgi:hypothetical protein
MPPLHSVLLVDDDPTTNFLNKLLLTSMQVSEQLFVAENGEQALRALTQHCTPLAATCPQLILLDMNMPATQRAGFFGGLCPTAPSPRAADYHCHADLLRAPARPAPSSGATRCRLSGQAPHQGESHRAAGGAFPNHAGIGA